MVGHGDTGSLCQHGALQSYAPGGLLRNRGDTVLEHTVSGESARLARSMCAGQTPEGRKGSRYSYPATSTHCLGTQEQTFTAPAPRHEHPLSSHSHRYPLALRTVMGTHPEHYSLLYLQQACRLLARDLGMLAPSYPCPGLLFCSREDSLPFQICLRLGAEKGLELWVS